MAMPKLDDHGVQGRRASSPAASSRQMVGLAEKARRNGLLALEEDVARDRRRLHEEGPSAGRRRHRLGSRPRRSSSPRSTAWRSAITRSPSMFTTAGGFAPTLGILGTVMGLVHVLENLSSAVDARARDRRRVHRHALRRRRAPTCIFLPDRQQAQGDVGRRGQPPLHGARGDPRRSRPATTRACWPRSSRAFLPPAKRGAPPRRARPRSPRSRRGAAGGMSGHASRRGAARRCEAAAGTRAATSAGSSPTPT